MLKSLVHSAFTLVIILTLLFGAFIKTGITLHFYWNQQQLAEQFCENKSKPKLKCNGKCYLAKKLKAETSTSQPVPVNPAKSLHVPDWNFICVSSQVSASLLVDKNKHAFETLYFNLSSASLAVITPPPDHFRV